MKKLLYAIDQRIDLIFILMMFWGFFWTLNGGDKFFNGQTVRSASGSGVLVDDNGSVAYTIHGMEPEGYYGVNRDAKMIRYFERLYLPKELALGALYGMAVFEIILGACFLMLFGWSLLPGDRQSQFTLFADRTIQRLVFKGSILVFVAFSVGDILFGDRAELWEHGTFIVLCLVTYDMWFRTDRFLLDLSNDEAARASRSLQAGTYLSDK